MANIRKGDGYGARHAGPTGGGGTYAPPPRKRPAPTYGAPAAATVYGAAPIEKRRFPYVLLAVLCILAVLLVIGLAKYGIKDTQPYVAPPRPPVVNEPTDLPPVYTPVSNPLARTG